MQADLPPQGWSYSPDQRGYRFRAKHQHDPVLFSITTADLPPENFGSLAQFSKKMFGESFLTPDKIAHKEGPVFKGNIAWERTDSIYGESQANGLAHFNHNGKTWFALFNITAGNKQAMDKHLPDLIKVMASFRKN